MSRTELKTRCMNTLNEAGRVGTDETAIQHGINFYKYMFGYHSDLRKYFKGAENFTPEDVQNSERFAKQGQRILLATRVVVNTYDDPDTFKAYAREMVNRHIKFKMDRSLWLVS
ncbi:unnamed protein product [Gongylonema pulchrum]|uniref:GLOBIN domain-containing protein n=1 Tax=Gongylonema pulchrum TaxID=637853 RepID=A0A183D3G1_9BILA|nr:unnamed protein product [Gongylonema pulchrum]